MTVTCFCAVGFGAGGGCICFADEDISGHGFQIDPACAVSVNILTVGAAGGEVGAEMTAQSFHLAGKAAILRQVQFQIAGGRLHFDPAGNVEDLDRAAGRGSVTFQNIQCAAEFHITGGGINVQINNLSVIQNQQTGSTVEVQFVDAQIANFHICCRCIDLNGVE